MMKPDKQLITFLCFHLIIWSILPILLRSNLPMDSAEALVWGFVGEWGTPKHPPLSGWIANLIYQITQTPYSLYVLSQLFIVGGLIYIYKLAKEFFSAEKALAAVLVMEGIVYYNLTTTEYNVNVVSMMLWPATSYYFYKALKENRFCDWSAFGICAGFNVLNKYVSGVLLFALGLYLLLTTEGRKSLKSWKLYIAAIIALGLIVPHVWWLYEREWFVIEYFASRSGGKILPYGLGHIIYPIRFLIAQLLAAGLAVIVLIIARKKAPEQNGSCERTFIFYAGILPLLLMALISAVAGIKLKSMWGTPTLYMMSIAFFAWFPINTEQTRRFFVKASYGMMLLFALIGSLQMWLTDSPKYKLDAKDYTAFLQAENYDFVGGSVWLASTLSVYANNHPKVLYFMEQRQNPWIKTEDIKKKGILVVEEELSTYKLHQSKFKNLPDPKIYDLVVKTPFGKEKHYPLYYGAIAGE